jgi:phospholipid transport system substrate-binding protein
MTALPSPLFALGKPGAEKLINNLSRDVMNVINSGRKGNAMYREFDKVFGKYAAVDSIARACLGPPWRTASAAQQKAYIAAFRGYLSRKYGKRFREFIGSEIKVVSSKPVKSGYLVKSIVKFKGSAPFQVDWQVFERNGTIQMFDLYIEGISMIKSEREEVGVMLDKSRGNIDKLVSRLNKAG